MTPDERTLQRGRRRLRDLLPAARAKVRAGYSLENPSPLARAFGVHVREDNIDAVVVHPGPKGGWHCDVLLRDVPPGVPNCIGSPIATPFHTEREAEAYAVDALALALAMERDRKAGALPLGKPVFWLHDLTLELSPDVLQRAAKVRQESFDMTRDDVIAGLRRTLSRLGLEHDATLEQVEALPEMDRVLLAANLHGAAACGLFTWPPRMDAPPGDETPMRPMLP